MGLPRTVDNELSDHGRALAAALLGVVDLRARPLPDGAGGPATASAGSRSGAVALLDAPTTTAFPHGPAIRVTLPHLDGVDPTFGMDELRDRGVSEARGGAVAFEWMIVVTVAFVVAFAIKTYAIQTFEIPSESMEHTLEIGDRVVVSKLAYSIGGGVERGDVVVFHRPPAAHTDDPNEPAELIKRVIGVPGDTVEARQGLVYVNGKPLKESGYLPAGVVSRNFPSPIGVGKGQVFVMGDNRPHSYDSRFFGPIPTSTIVGRAIIIVWPFSRLTGL